MLIDQQTRALLREGACECTFCKSRELREQMIVGCRLERLLRGSNSDPRGVERDAASCADARSWPDSILIHALILPVRRVSSGRRVIPSGRFVAFARRGSCRRMYSIRHHHRTIADRVRESIVKVATLFWLVRMVMRLARV
jgi:hypothetical protein